jgi:hypothetical protein
MILKNKNGRIDKNPSKGFFIKFIFIKYTCFLLLSGLLLLGIYLGSKQVQTKGYNGLFDFITSIGSNYWNARNVNPENISIEIKKKDLKKLEKHRENALERNVIINELDGEYVPATIEYLKKKIKIKLRLKGHMTDHLQNNKWSFRVKVKDDDTFMGMKRFSIQHPGTRGYIYEWIYHELMKREGIIALKYKFVNVTVNGKDWGIYAVEENFDEELIANNNRVKGPLIRFNPDLYWVNRRNEMNGIKPSVESASYYSAQLEAYNEEKILKDSVQYGYYLKALALMEGFRERKISVDQAFDIPRLAKFHAIIDLVGGQHSIDWSDIKYYYNPVTARLEPVAYESFTVFPFESIAGNYRYVDMDSSQNYIDLHTALFSNPVFFKNYIKELERISDPAYLDTFFSETDTTLKKNLAILYKEFPYKKFDPQNYYRNQLMIKKIVDAPKMFHAYFYKIAGKDICLQIGEVESLPVEITSVQIGKNTLQPSSGPIILPSKQPNQYIRYKNYYFSLPAHLKWNDSLVAAMKINYKLLGATTLKQEKVFSFPHTDQGFIVTDLKSKESTLNNFPFLIINEAQKMILFKPGSYTISQDLIIPAGYKAIANSGVTIDFKNGAKILSYSSCIFSGTEEEPVIIQSSDSTGQGIVLINADERSLFKYVIFKDLPRIKDPLWQRKGAITCYESPVAFIHCDFKKSSAHVGINLIRTKFSFQDCNFQQMPDFAIRSDFSTGEITTCSFLNCGNVVDGAGGTLALKAVYIIGSKDKALIFKGGSQVKGYNIHIKASNIAIVAEDQADVNLQTVEIIDCQIGLWAHRKIKHTIPPTCKLSGLVMARVNRNYLIEKKSMVTVNGIEQVPLDSEVNKEDDEEQNN